jgi:hypothetical protein
LPVVQRKSVEESVQRDIRVGQLGHAHYELAIDAPPAMRVTAAFAELARAI